jgi:hypothetical protein
MLRVVHVIHDQRADRSLHSFHSLHPPRQESTPMITLRHCQTAVAIAALFAASGAFATTMTKADVAATKDRITATFKADKAACATSSGNAKDICIEQADGKEKIARAELEYNRTGKADDAHKLAIAKADSAYSIAKEMCDEKAGHAKDVCTTEAKATHTKALADAKLTEKVGDAKKDAAVDKRDADYKVAAEKCGSLAGDAKAACISAAKAQYGKS